MEPKWWTDWPSDRQFFSFVKIKLIIGYCFCVALTLLEGLIDNVFSHILSWTHWAFWTAEKCLYFFPGGKLPIGIHLQQLTWIQVEHSHSSLWRTTNFCSYLSNICALSLVSVHTDWLLILALYECHIPILLCHWTWTYCFNLFEPTTSTVIYRKAVSPRFC